MQGSAHLYIGTPPYTLCMSQLCYIMHQCCLVVIILTLNNFCSKTLVVLMGVWWWVMSQNSNEGHDYDDWWQILIGKHFLFSKLESTLLLQNNIFKKVIYYPAANTNFIKWLQMVIIPIRRRRTIYQKRLRLYKRITFTWHTKDWEAMFSWCYHCLLLLCVLSCLH